MYSFSPTWGALALGILAAILLAAALALLIGLFSLRVRAIFFAMITLAVASAFAIQASQLNELTGGEDGRSYKVPELLRSEEHTSELQSLMRISYAVFCLKKKNKQTSI